MSAVPLPAPNQAPTHTPLPDPLPDPLPPVDPPVTLVRVAATRPPADVGAGARWLPTTLAVLPGGGARARRHGEGRVPGRSANAPRRGAITDAAARGLASTAARAVLDVLAGARPPATLRPLLDDRALQQVATMLRGGLSRPVRRRANPVPSVRITRVHQPAPDAIEACGVFTGDGCVRAVALRVERVGRRWMTTAIRVG